MTISILCLRKNPSIFANTRYLNRKLLIWCRQFCINSANIEQLLLIFVGFHPALSSVFAEEVLQIIPISNYRIVITAWKWIENYWETFGRLMHCRFRNQLRYITPLIHQNYDNFLCKPVNKYGWLSSFGVLLDALSWQSHFLNV